MNLALVQREVKSNEAAKALDVLIRYIEQLEERAMCSKMPEAELSSEELRELSDADKAIEKGESITLEEFNRQLKETISDKDSSQS